MNRVKEVKQLDPIKVNVPFHLTFWYEAESEAIATISVAPEEDFSIEVQPDPVKLGKAAIGTKATVEATIKRESTAKTSIVEIRVQLDGAPISTLVKVV